MHNRAFTLVELAIVIVIAGILAAVAIPIYQGIVEKSKWSEGKANVGLVNAALKVIKAEESGQVPAAEYPAGVAVIDYNALDLTESEFNSDNFVSTDYSVAALDRTLGTYTLQCSNGGDGVPVGGPYRVDQEGVILNDAP